MKQRPKRERISKLLFEVRKKKKKKPTPNRDDDRLPVDIVPDFEYNDSNDDMSTSSNASEHLESDFSDSLDDLISLPEGWNKGEKYYTGTFDSFAFNRTT